jgi:hypothetical protein
VNSTQKWHREYYLAHREHLLIQARAGYARRKKQNPGYSSNKPLYKRGKLGWTAEAFEQSIKEQNNKCAICGRTLDRKSQHLSPAADHEHVHPPKPRGVLCGQCNVGLGSFQDDPNVLKKAVAYLNKWGKI